MIIYIAGPMTGVVNNNYVAFNEMAARLREMDHVVLNPAELPAPPQEACLAGRELWTSYMRQCLALVTTTQCIVMLAGWRNSEGAQKEYALAGWLDIPVIYSWIELKPQLESVRRRLAR